MTTYKKGRKGRNFHLLFELESTENLNIDTILAEAVQNGYTVEKLVFITGYDENQDEELVEGYITFNPRVNVTAKLDNFFKRIGPVIKSEICTNIKKTLSIMIENAEHINSMNSLKQYGIKVKEFLDDDIRSKKKRKRDSINDQIWEDIKSNKKMREYQALEKEYGSAVIVKQGMVGDMISMANEFEERDRKLKNPFVAPVPTDKYGQGWLQVMIWMQKVIRKDLTCRRKHLWLHGPTGTGKTTRLLNILLKMLFCYKITRDKVQNHHYLGGYDLIYADEYNAPHKNVDFMNDITTYNNGNPIDIRIPGGNHMSKFDFPPVLIISNGTIDEIYAQEKQSFPEHFEALKSRFYEIQVTEQGNPFEIDDTDVQEQEELDNCIYNFEYETVTQEIIEKERNETLQWLTEKINETDSEGTNSEDEQMLTKTKCSTVE